MTGPSILSYSACFLGFCCHASWLPSPGLCAEAALHLHTGQACLLVMQVLLSWPARDESLRAGPVSWVLSKYAHACSALVHLSHESVDGMPPQATFDAQVFAFKKSLHYHRIDGQVSPAKRDEFIQDFTNPGSESKVGSPGSAIPAASTMQNTC